MTSLSKIINLFQTGISQLYMEIKSLGDPLTGISDRIDFERIRTTLADLFSNGRDKGTYCFSQFWTIHEKNYDTVPAVSSPFRSFMFLSLPNVLSFSTFASRMARITSGSPP
jgi:hypothetical protein